MTLSIINIFWPCMPTKIPSDIPKFEWKAWECPQNHIMMFHLWFSSNNIVDDSIRLRVFQHTLTGVQPSGTLSYHKLSIQISTHFPLCSCNIFKSPSDMMKGWKSCYLAAKTLWPTSPTTSTNGGNIAACARPSLMTGSFWTSFWKPFYHQYPRTSPPNVPKQRKRPSWRPNSLTSFTHILDTSTPSF